MNNVVNNILKKQYIRFINGTVKKLKDGQYYLVSKGFTTVNLSEFKKYMKNNGVEI